VWRATPVHQIEQLVEVDRSRAGEVMSETRPEPGKLEPTPAPCDDGVRRLPGSVGHRR